MVVHGGYSGEINFGCTAGDVSIEARYIFECTLEENRALEKDFVLPTLTEVIQLLGKEVFINIEMKVPIEAEARGLYDWHKAVRVIHSTVVEHQLRDYCFVSSFDYEALEELELVSHAEFYNVRTIYLTNFYHHLEVPPMEKIVKMGDGVNVQFEHITKELVDYLHQHGKIICVWVDAEQTFECAEVYCRIYDLGIDSYCTDYPLYVQTVWENYGKLLQTVTNQAEKDQLMMRLRANKFECLLASDSERVSLELIDEKCEP